MYLAGMERQLPSVERTQLRHVRPSSFYLRLLLAITLIVAALIVGRVMTRTYSAEMLDFASWPVKDIIYHPEQTGVSGLVNVSIPTVNGQHVMAWFAPSRNRAAVILWHGTNADRSDLLAEIRILAAAGFGILAVDGPGYGGSDGKVLWSEPERQALSAALDWLVARPNVDASRIGGFGFSMGGLTLAQAAAKDKRLRALTFAATPPDIRETIAWQYSRWGFLSRASAALALRNSGMELARFQPREVIGAISPRPVFIIGEERDPLVPAFMVQELFTAAHEPKTLWIVPGDQHGQYAKVAPVEYARRLVDFYQRNLVGTTAAR
jgi:uncharacterized protein